ncbi:Rab GDI protein [Sesbania bispinosa]|nr:Rab GDI protein [Sesbania bispinosa]
MANGNLVRVLIHTDVTKYLYFKAVDGSFVYNKAKVHKVPSNDMEALKSPLMGIFEKRRARKFFIYVQDYNENDPKTHDGMDLTRVTTRELIAKFGLDDNTIDFIGHALALHRDDHYLNEPALDTVKRMKLYAESLARFQGGSPYIYPLYGLGELPQAFARLSAVYGGTYMLNKPECKVEFDEEGKVVGVTSEGETAKCKKVVCDPSYLPGKRGGMVEEDLGTEYGDLYQLGTEFLPLHRLRLGLKWRRDIGLSLRGSNGLPVIFVKTERRNGGRRPRNRICLPSTHPSMPPITISSPLMYWLLVQVRKVGRVARAIAIMSHPIPSTNDSHSVQVILPQKQLGRKSDMYLFCCSYTHNVAPKGKFIAFVSTEAETDQPAIELKPGIDLLGPVDEIFFDMYDRYEPVNEPSLDNCFVSTSYDATTHFESTVVDVLNMYTLITGKNLRFPSSPLYKAKNI